jgi:hypothetical protein
MPERRTDRDEIVFESPADQAGFVMFPNVVLMDETISVPARLLYAMLIKFAREKDNCFPGQPLLAGKLRVSDRQVRTYVKELEDVMLVRREQRGQGKSCRYVLLALGLRAKRLAERVRQGSPEAEFQADARKSTSAQPGSQLPAEVKAPKENQQHGECAREKKLKISGKPVKPDLWQLTVEILGVFNELAGKSLGALTGSGGPSEAAKRIYSRVAEWPELTLDQHRDVIDRTLTSKWWGDGEPSVGVVYGPKVFEENMTRKPTAQQTKSAAKQERAARDREALARVIASRRQA